MLLCVINVCPVHAVDLNESTLRGLLSSLDKKGRRASNSHFPIYSVLGQSQVNNVAAVAIKVVSDVIYLASFIISDGICRDEVFTTLVVGFVRHALILPVSLYFLSVIFLLCERCVCPMRSLRFLLRRKAKIGLLGKEDAILLLVCRRCQCFLITSLTFGMLLLNVVQKRTRLFSVFS